MRIASVEDVVPESVKLINLIVIRKWECVCTVIAFRVFGVVPVFTVEGLVDISEVVNQ